MVPDLSVEALVNACAVACHEANRRHCEKIGDKSQVPWNEAPEWQRKSAINGAAKIISGEIATPEQSHESWMAEKISDGWSYGSVKDVDNKTHPCIVPYADLPEDQRVKDTIFFDTINNVRDAMNCED